MTIVKPQYIKYKIKRIKALFIKEFYQMFKDPIFILVAFIFPAFLLMIYCVGVSLNIEHLKVGIALEDTNPDANNFFLSVKNSKYFSVKVARDQKELEKQLIAGKLKGLIIVPFYFSEYNKRPDHKGPVQVIADGSEPNTAKFVQNYIEGAFDKSNLQIMLNTGQQDLPLINVESRYWFNETLNSRHFLIPGSIALIITLVGSLLTALVVTREWERGTMETLMATPVTIREILLSKTLAYFVLGIALMFICAIVSIVFFKVPFRGSFFLLTIVSSVFLLTALGTGLLISSFTKNQFLASQVAIVFGFLPAFMLSGFLFEISSMPFLIKLLTYIIPARYMVSCLQSLFLVGNIWYVLIINTSIMFLIAFILFFIIYLKPRKRLD